ncbi:DUF4861 domain-containing protein [Algibacter amylolyticus]|uniref:DUF4861 domain-containing protein n=1 Tax=Algibacter amylolyticus TaxID=1608400 RepID=A0A5M7BIH4_9FLAO|nr:DUF4861 family protein [Algibacter amylolyticus]KAA5827987.1 DUF4861 domain-containing protein [Algibacter amylolyticus]MBB5267227.1 hypothetical protein [Algibacter amylolyticus]TSJ82232.1 DUF4861 domain-containing protein [Algibacter amylolyticus]
MRKIAVLSVALLCLFSCKDKQSKTNTNTTVGEEITEVKTYAELSIAQGGEWKDGPRGHKEYSNGTSFKNVNSLQVPQEHTDHTWFLRYEGPGWENSQIGYRLYLDWRNAIDIYGKKVDSLVLPYVGQDGFDSYHEPADWGQDILKAGKSMGIGGYGRIVADTVVHFQSVKSTFAKMENLNASSSVNIEYKGWESGDESIDLTTKLTIYPEDRFTKAELTPSKAIPGICTGIVKHGIKLQKKEGSKWAYISTYGKQTLASPPDNLGMALFYKLDEVAEQKEGIDDYLVVFKPANKTLTYYFLGAWEQEKNGIKTEEAFIGDLNKKLESLEKTNSIN